VSNDPKKANEAFERAAVEGPDRAQLNREYAGAQGGLPTYFKSGNTRVDGPRLHQITAQEASVFGSPRAVTCGSCKYFDLENGRKEIARQRFGEKLVADYEWKLKHLGAEPDAIGLCGASGGDTATTFVSKACDQYRPRLP
jgi:hypothetical protein